MGIGKNTEGYSVYEEYTADIVLFIRNLSEKLNSDFKIRSYDKDYIEIYDKTFQTNFGKKTIYDLTITYDEYRLYGNKVELPTYELSIPINYVLEDSIELNFYPNHSVLFMFLTFEDMWYNFIEILKFKYPKTRTTSVERYELLRIEYSKILKALEMDSIFICTHANYNMENLDNIEEYQKIVFSDIETIANLKDNISTFELDKILYAKSVNDLNVEFIDKQNLSISFVDNLHFR